MILQMHMQDKTNLERTVLCEQREVFSVEERSAFIGDVINSTPLQEGMQWLMVEEGSPRFVGTPTDEESKP